MTGARKAPAQPLGREVSNMDSETVANWTRPGAHAVAPGIFRIPLPLPMDGLRAVNVYAITSAGGVVLIDGGWAIAEAEEALTEALGLIGYGMEQVTDVLVTHAHRDHYTLAVTLRRKWGARIGIGAGERVNMAELAVRPEWSEPRQVPMLRRAGAGELAEAMRDLDSPFDNSVWAPPDTWIADGSVIPLPDGRELTAVHTPGHTTGHLVFLDRQHGVLFTGDHVLPHITPSIGYEQVPSDLPLADYLASLTLLRGLPDCRLLPAHGPATVSVQWRAEELLEHHARRLDMTVQALAQRPCSAFEVADRLTWTRHEKSLADLDPWNQSLATLETVAHLEVLVEREVLGRSQDSVGVVRYVR